MSIDAATVASRITVTNDVDVIGQDSGASGHVPAATNWAFCLGHIHPSPRSIVMKKSVPIIFGATIGLDVRLGAR